MMRLLRIKNKPRSPTAHRRPFDFIEAPVIASPVDFTRGKVIGGMQMISGWHML
jgi:hypothetical protein